MGDFRTLCYGIQALCSWMDSQLGMTAKKSSNGISTELAFRPAEIMIGIN